MRASFFLAAMAAVCLYSCAPSESGVFTVKKSFLLEGPLFEGPNSGQSSLADEFTAWLTDQGIAAEEVKEVKLVEVTLGALSNPSDGLVTDAGLTFAGGDLEMTQVAVLNPVPSSAEGAKLKTSAEANITSFFGLEAFIVLLDLGLAQDLDDNLEATVEMKFEVTYKAKAS